MLSLKNEKIKAVFSPHGAELQSLVNQKTGQEYLWQADPKFWGRHAPVLFPIVGRLKNNKYRFAGKTYEMHQHGFARDLDFAVVKQTTKQLVFGLKNSPATQKLYPFEFELFISYQLKDDQLQVSYQVKNPAAQKLLFSLGGHPAFTVPLAEDENFNDYLVEFQPVGDYQKIPLTGSYTDFSAAQKDRLAGLKLSHETFKNDALIYQLQQKPLTLELTTSRHQHGVLLKPSAADYIGIWSPYPAQAPFVCLEPWWGLADDLTASGELSQKRGLHQLNGYETFTAGFEITIF